MKNGNYAIYEKLAKACPQPFTILDVVSQVKNHDLDMADSHPNLEGNLRTWASTMVKDEKLFKIDNNGNGSRFKKYSFDPADKPASTESAPEKGGKTKSKRLIRFEVVMPPNCSKITLEIDGVEYTVLKGNEYGL